MAPYRTYLSLASLVLMLLLPGALQAARQECVTCHGTHFASRGSCVSCHRGNDRTRHLRVAHDGMIPGKYAWSAIPGAEPVARGRRLLTDLGCLRCHSMGSKGNGLAAPLDAVPAEMSPGGIAAAITCPALYMPNFQLDQGRVTDLVNAILAGALRKADRAPERPVIVHFQKETGDNAFERRCGACHRALTRRLGGVGRGEIGPNLTGLFSGYYPATFRQKARWSQAHLKEWLANPRRFRRLSTMPPVTVTSQELVEIAALL